VTTGHEGRAERMLTRPAADDEDQLRKVHPTGFGGYHGEASSPSPAMLAYSQFVSEEPRVPFAIRVVRPYATAEEFLERELDTLSPTTISLIGTQSKPVGVVLRFELTLSTGAVLIRGEGRTLGYRPDARDGQGELTLRFTRLDTSSKALVDRATELRSLVRGARPAKPELPVAVRPDPAAESPSQSAPQVPATPSPTGAADSGHQGRPASISALTPEERESVLLRLRQRQQHLDITIVRRERS
jgi:hypothetical protein